MGDKIKQFWLYIQDLLDVRGDVIMMAMSSVFIARVAYAAFGHPALSANEAAMYAAAIGSFAYSNRGPKS
jgi:hypothetical protein